MAVIKEKGKKIYVVYRQGKAVIWDPFANRKDAEKRKTEIEKMLEKRKNKEVI